MLRRTWQIVMIGLARSPSVTTFMQRNRRASFLVKKYVAGADSAQAMTIAGELLTAHGIRSSLFYLGEYVNRVELVEENVAEKLAIARALGNGGLDVHVSVDPTQIGRSLDPALARDNAVKIADEIRRVSAGKRGVHCLMLDMEDASLIDPTISLHDDLKQRGLPVALTLQAYLRRTFSDMQAQMRAGSRVRLVKGAFAATAALHTHVNETSRRTFGG